MSEPLLKTRNVFVDTQAYLQQRLRFDHPTLKRLQELGHALMVHILSTDVVVGEIRKKVADQIKEATEGLTRFRREAAIVRAYVPEKLAPLFEPVDETTLIQSGFEAWSAFLTEANVEILKASSVETTDLLEMYFSAQPPFGSSAKKSEFPDAISALALEDWCNVNDQQIYVISGDSDLKAWCNGKAHLHHLSSLTEFLDVYNRAEETLTELAHKIFENEEASVSSAIKESFLECGFQYADNWDADVENVQVTSMQVDDVSVIEVDEERFVLVLQMEIGCRASVSGPDYDRGSWDSEDKRYVYLPTFDIEVESTERYDVSLEVLYDIDDGKISEIKDVMFNDGRDITIYNEDRWPYK
jgi:hypothetical protein